MFKGVPGFKGVFLSYIVFRNRQIDVNSNSRVEEVFRKGLVLAGRERGKGPKDNI